MPHSALEGFTHSNSPFPSKKNNQVLVAQKVATGVYKGVTTTELDELAAETAASMTATHPDYAVVSFRDDEGRGRESIRARKEGADVEFVSLLLALSLSLSSHLE